MVIGVLVNKCCLRRYDSLHVDVSTEKVIISHCYIKVCRLQICIHVSFVFLISKHGLFSINLHNPPPPHTHTHARTHTHTHMTKVKTKFRHSFVLKSFMKVPRVGERRHEGERLFFLGQ